jgi:diguanylate cyclase (GGDEF)-like protein
MPLLIRQWRPALASLLALALAGLALAAVLRLASGQLLERDAARSALGWANLVEATVDDLEALFAGQGLSPAARDGLVRLRGAQEVFRFNFFDRRGEPLFSSDELVGRPAAARQTVGEGDGALRARVLSGHTVVALEREDAPGLPAVYSEAYVPVMHGGRMLGVVEVYVDQVERAQRIDAAFLWVSGGVFALLALCALAVGAVLVHQWRRDRLASARLDYLARHDPLSGALNRGAFTEALRQAAWRQAGGGPGFALLCIDLDRFRDVNEGLGPSAGDEMLRQTAARLRALVRLGDPVARLGADEFAILQTGADGPVAASRLAARIVQALSEPFDLRGQLVACGCSVGVALCSADADNDRDLIHRADLALSRAKAGGRGRYSFYDATLDEQLDASRQLARDLREAIGTPQLSLHYQAVWAADGRSLIGYEALMRWTHPQRGPVSPAEFIPLAEDTGLIGALGRWGLRAACSEAASWPEHLKVAVNLSAAQFRQDDLVSQIACTLDETGLPARRLEIEITESLLINNTEQVLTALRALAALGVAIAMDDFGTGYSSLAYLWQFPFDKVKIDRTFTQNLGNDAKVDVIVKSIITLAHSLAIRVNAEGVETRPQLQALQALGCDEFQGFLLARPKPVGQLAHEPAAMAG